MNRREFFRNAGLLASGAIAADQLELVERLGWVRRLFPGWRREPWVRIGSHAPLSYIGAHPSPSSFIGGVLPRAVEKWDGRGYPVVVDHPCWPPLQTRIYDHDLAEFNREVPDRFWWDKANCDRYPNVHTYVRMQRYGETREQAMRHLNFRLTGKWQSPRPLTENENDGR